MDSWRNGNTRCFECPGTSDDQFNPLFPLALEFCSSDLMNRFYPYNFQGRIKGYPIWSDPNRVDLFLNENSQPPAACPSIVNSKALGKFPTHYISLLQIYLELLVKKEIIMQVYPFRSCRDQTIHEMEARNYCEAWKFKLQINHGLKGITIVCYLSQWRICWWHYKSVVLSNGFWSIRKLCILLSLILLWWSEISFFPVSEICIQCVWQLMHFSASFGDNHFMIKKKKKPS